MRFPRILHNSIERYSSFALITRAWRRKKRKKERRINIVAVTHAALNKNLLSKLTVDVNKWNARVWPSLNGSVQSRWSTISDRRSTAEIGNPVVNLRAKRVRDHVIRTILISLGGKGKMTGRRKRRKKKRNRIPVIIMRHARHEYTIIICLRNASL